MGPVCHETGSFFDDSPCKARVKHWPYKRRTSVHIITYVSICASGDLSRKFTTPVDHDTGRPGGGEGRGERGEGRGERGEGRGERGEGRGERGEGRGERGEGRGERGEGEGRGDGQGQKLIIYLTIVVMQRWNGTSEIYVIGIQKWNTITRYYHLGGN